MLCLLTVALSLTERWVKKGGPGGRLGGGGGGCVGLEGSAYIGFAFAFCKQNDTYHSSNCFAQPS